MKNWFKNFKEKRVQRRKLRENGRLFETFRTLERMEQSGLLWFDEEHRRLLIERSLAVLMMKDAETWTRFLNRCWQWQYLRECQKAWDGYIQKEELAAVRAAVKAIENGKLKIEDSQLSRRDIERIKDARRLEIAQSDMEPPKVQEFEFFVIGPQAKSMSVENGNRKSEDVPSSRIFLVGSYSPEMEYPEMATWEDVKPLLGEHP